MPESFHFRLAATDGTGSGHEGCKKPKGIPINESALRDVEAAAIGQQVLVFEAATGRGIDEAFERLAREKVDALFVTGGGSSARGASSKGEDDVFVCPAAAAFSPARQSTAPLPPNGDSRKGAFTTHPTRGLYHLGTGSAITPVGSYQIETCRPISTTESGGRRKKSLT